MHLLANTGSGKMKKVLLILLSFCIYLQAYTIDSVGGNFTSNSQFKILYKNVSGGKGYSIIRLTGADTVRGWWYGYYCADEIQNIYDNTLPTMFPIYNDSTTAKDSSTLASFTTTWFNRTYATLNPALIREIAGMYAGFKAKKPTSTMTGQQFYIALCWVEFAHGWYCRAQAAWGGYVTAPIKMVAQRRADWGTPTNNHYTIAVHVPPNGKPFVLWDMAGAPFGTTVYFYGKLIGTNTNSGTRPMKFWGTTTYPAQAPLFYANRWLTETVYSNDSTLLVFKSRKWCYPAYNYVFDAKNEKANLYEMGHDTAQTKKYLPPVKWNSNAIAVANDTLTKNDSTGYVIQDSSGYNTLFSSSHYSAHNLTIDTMWNNSGLTNNSTLYNISMEYRDSANVRFYFQGRKTIENSLSRFDKLDLTLNYLLNDTNTVIVNTAKNKAVYHRFFNNSIGF
jgi:hypothetical protein